MKRILLLTLEYPPDRGGVSRYYAGLARAMPKGSIVVYRARLSRWIWPRWLPLLWHVWRVVRREKITDIWVGHLLPLGTVVYLLKKITDYRLQITVFVHGYDLLLAETHPRKRALARRILENADRIVTNSEYGKGLVVARGIFEAKIRVVYPCPTPTFSPLQRGSERGFDVRKQYHLQDKKILLTVARLVERKGIDFVLEALKKLDDPNLVYVIVGDGPLREALEVQSHPPAGGSKVESLFVGAVGDAALVAWYELCDVFILTPRKIGPDVEGFGLVYLEANAFGKPVIGSRTGGVSEAVVDGETGLLVDEGDVSAIANAIQRLFSDEALRKKLGERGRARVEREFEWEWQARKLL